MINGVLNIYKEAGYTSHDAVARLRGILGQKKIGHTGTLDPEAVGVLPVCLGKATRLVEHFSEDKKTYEAVLLLGRVTDTQDIQGAILATAPVSCTEEELRALIPRFLGRQDQIPPMYSAKKQGGRRLYELARRGQVVERKAVPICIDALEILSMDLPRITLRVTCSKGTYIRTLCHDIGAAAGCGGCMEALIRTRVGSFVLTEAHTLREIEDAKAENRLTEWILPVDTFFADLPAYRTNATADALARNGNGIVLSSIQGIENCTSADGTGKIRLYDSIGAFLGIYRERAGSKIMFPEIFFYDPADSEEAI